MTGFFAILKNVSMLADDASLAIKNTASILSDDIAVTAEQSTSFRASRELPSIWAITKGSFVNKLIVLPAIFLLSVFLPNAIIPILILGGVYLSYEGFEKILEYITDNSEDESSMEELSNNDLLEKEKVNVKKAIMTDFVLSVEIVLVALSAVINKGIMEQIIITTLASFAATIGVYGIVALIVRLDDIGMWFVQKKQQRLGLFLIKAMSITITALGYIGTIAMLLVAGEIFVHNIHFLHKFFENHLNFSGMLYILRLLAEILISSFIGMITFMVSTRLIKYWMNQHD